MISFLTQLSALSFFLSVILGLGAVFSPATPAMVAGYIACTLTQTLAAVLVLHNQRKVAHKEMQESLDALINSLKKGDEE